MYIDGKVGSIENTREVEVQQAQKMKLWLYFDYLFGLTLKVIYLNVLELLETYGTVIEITRQVTKDFCFLCLWFDNRGNIEKLQKRVTDRYYGDLFYNANFALTSRAYKANNINIYNMEINLYG